MQDKSGGYFNSTALLSLTVMNFRRRNLPYQRGPALSVRF